MLIAHLTEMMLKKLLMLRGLDFSGYRRETLFRRIEARLEYLGIPPENYPQYFDQNPAETDRLIDVLVVNVSFFFRDPLCFELIGQQILPRIIGEKKKRNSREIRVWSAGCANGEEAWSLAIFIAEALRYETEIWFPFVFATDISKEALKTASIGSYRRESFAQTRLGILDRYFTRKNDGYEIRTELRRMVRFSRDDLTSDQRVAPAESIFGAFDLILCRNVLIYFSADLQNKVQRKLIMALNRGGYLVLGTAESPAWDTDSGMHTVDRNCRIFRKEVA
ncbi:MAG: protein-glutamate O-methyltransferase CheR [Desulfobacterales bacterium]